MYDRAFLEKYFSEVWTQIDRSSRTGKTEQYINEIADGESVLDAGCGTNPFKSVLSNVYGIDITDVGSDEVVAIEDFKSVDKFDVALCLGSINFGDEDLIRRQISSVVGALKPDGRIYWRMNPGLRDHGFEGTDQIDFFPWDEFYIREFASEFGFDVVDIEYETNSRGERRIYSKWTR